MQQETLQKQLQKKLKDYTDLDTAFKKQKEAMDRMRREVSELVIGKR